MNKSAFVYDETKSIEFNEGREAFLREFEKLELLNLDEFELEAEQARFNKYDVDADDSVEIACYEDFSDGWNFEIDNAFAE